MIEKLTKKQVAKLSYYKDKWLNKIFKYELYNSITERDVINNMEELYKFCHLEKPAVILVDSPMGCQIAASLLKNQDQVRDQVGDQVINQVGGQVRGQVIDQVEDQVRGQVGGQVMDQIRGQVINQVGGQVRDQVINQIRGQVGNQVRDQVEDQVRDQVINQVENQVRDQVRDQIIDQVGDQVIDQVGDQVINQVGNQVRDQVRDQVGGQVRGQVGGQVRSQVIDQVEDQVRGQVIDQVEDQVRGQVRGQVGGQVIDQIIDQVIDQVGVLKYTTFSSYINYSDFGWLSYYDFFLNETNIINNLQEKLLKIISFTDCCFMSIQLSKFCIVSRFPSFITRNSQNQLHNINEAAICFKDGYKQHYFNGIFITPELFYRLISKSYTFEDWSKESNEEIKSLVLAFYEEKFGGEFVYRFLSQYLKEIDSYTDKKSEEYLKNTTKGMNLGVYTLYKGTVNNTKIAYVRCYCPSTDRMFFLGVHPEITNAKDAIASLCQIPAKLKENLISINRQGEIFSFNFDKVGTDLLKSNSLTKEDINNVISLKGDEYFNKIKFEY